MTASPELRAAAQVSKAWPYEEARKLLARPAGDGPIVFETGYGPSGLPHIGTFGEVARTAMVRHAFAELSDRPTRLIAFSDDMDGLRKVPDNIPNREAMARWLGHPLSRVPDPPSLTGLASNINFYRQANATLRVASIRHCGQC